jgi:hypothetical protein
MTPQNEDSVEEYRLERYNKNESYPVPCAAGDCRDVMRRLHDVEVFQAELREQSEKEKTQRVVYFGMWIAIAVCVIYLAFLSWKVFRPKKESQWEKVIRLVFTPMCNAVASVVRLQFTLAAGHIEKIFRDLGFTRSALASK